MLVRLALVLAGNDVGIVRDHQDALLESNAVIGEHLVDNLVASHDPLLSYVATVCGDFYLISGFFSMKSQVADLAPNDAFLIHVPQLVSWAVAALLLHGNGRARLRIVAWDFKYIAVGLID